MTASEFADFQRRLAAHLGVPESAVVVDVSIFPNSAYGHDAFNLVRACEVRHDIMARALELLPQGWRSMDHGKDAKPPIDSRWSSVRQAGVGEITLYHAPDPKRVKSPC